VREAARQPELAIEHERADEGRRVVAGGGEPLGQRRHVVAEHEVPVVADAVRVGIAPGHQRGVRGQRQRRR
jgi:hypothetical protein